MMRRFIVLFILLYCGALAAAPRSMRIQWSPVAGARGYAAQWETSDSPGAQVPQRKGETTVQSTSVDLRLDPGVYRIRVSALNRFGKPAGWSDWIEFKIEDTIKAQTLDLNKAEAENKKKAVEQSTVKKEPENKKAPGLSSWKLFFPGLVQIESGSRYGWLYPTALAGLTVYGINAKLKGDQIAGNHWNDPDYFVPLTLSSPLQTKMLIWQRRAAQRARYDARQQDQRKAALGILLLVAAHATEMYRWDFRDGRSALLFGVDGAAIQVRF